ncbi:cytochrome c oxidase assembly factor Coa1 family protein [Flavobacterium procerum]|uniref:Cytochrome c oxidase assembly factor Coa1 family protein n=1 Tax=Flavobacterium procerum TaxID=1455569 RepID=A0ABV6BJC9_9FLAO
MDNDLILKKSWLKKNWIWVVFSLFSTMLLFCILLNSNSKNGVTDTFTALNENSLYEKAIESANINSAVLKTFGKIDPIDKLAILEGNTSYSNNNNSVVLSVRIKGLKNQGKLEVHANKTDSEWIYKKIYVHTKNPKGKIIVLDQP